MNQTIPALHAVNKAMIAQSTNPPSRRHPNFNPFIMHTPR